MPKEKAQLKCLIKSVEGKEAEERTITFVASSAEQDRHYEKVDTASLRLPLKGGGEIIAGDIKADGVDNVDIPLMLNHSFDVKDVIGSVRKAYFENGELIFEAGISNREQAQEILQLIEEGHLDNAFSITMADFDYNQDSGEISNAEIIEVSVVFRGANKEARLLAVKSVEGIELVERNEDGSFKAIVDGKEVTLKADEATEAEVEEATEEKAEDEEKSEPEAEAENATETEGESVAEEEEKSEESEAETTEESTKEESEMDKEIAKEAIATPAVAVKATSENYLASKDYMNVFKKAIIDTKGQSAEATKAVLKAHLASKGITGDAILPTEIASIFFKTWEDKGSILSTFRNINAPAAALYAFGGEGEGIRAKGHKKGDQKAVQTVTSTRRDLKQKLVYKRQDYDLQDILDDTTGELLRFRVEELGARVANEIALGAILGDGRTQPESGADYRVFDGTRGLWSMAADIAGNTAYQNAVANAVTHSATDNIFDKIKKTLAQVRAINGGRKVVVVAPGVLTDFEISKTESGVYLIAPGTSASTLFPNTVIFEMDEMDGADYDVIAYADQGYALFSTNEMVRTAFDLDYNTDAMLVERSVAGSLYGNRVAAGYNAQA
jgi:hypothetical protein